MNIDKYMIAQEGIISNIKASIEKRKRVKELEHKFSNMAPMEAARIIFRDLSSFSKSQKGQEMGYRFAVGADADREIKVLCRRYQATPGKARPTVSKIVTLGNGVKCILVSVQNSEGKEVFNQLVVPVRTKQLRITEEIMTPYQAAKSQVMNG